VIAKAKYFLLLSLQKVCTFCVCANGGIVGWEGRLGGCSTCGVHWCDIIIVPPNFGSVFASPSTQCMAKVLSLMILAFQSFSFYSQKLFYSMGRSPSSLTNFLIMMWPFRFICGWKDILWLTSSFGLKPWKKNLDPRMIKSTHDQSIYEAFATPLQ
jgi:hypothetical protein